MTYQDIVNIIRNAANYVNPNGFFIHGRKTDGSLNYNEATPQILLLEPQPNTVNNNSSFIETITFPIVFITQDSPESTELRREDLKQEMYLLSRKLLAKIDEEPLLQNVNYTGGQPEIRQLSATLTGFSYSIQITYPLSECSLDFDLPPSIKLFATQTTVASGTTVQIGWIADNVNSVNITPFGVLQGQFGFINTVVNSTTTFTGSATNDNGTATDSITITVGIGCDDATAVLKDSANNTLSTTNIPSGDTEDIIAPDGTIQLFNTVPTLIQTETVRSNQTKSATIANVSWTDSDGSSESTPYGVPIVCSQAPVLSVNFSANDTTPVTNQTITFTDLTVGATQWLWDFGDGTSSDLQNPTKVYEYAGTYTVTLCATNGSTSGKEIKTNFIVCALQPLPSTNLQEHYQPMIGASPSNATLVSGAISQLNGSINGYNQTQAVVANRPLYLFPAVTAPNGIQYGAASYDGSNDFLNNNSAGFTRATGSFEVLVFRRPTLPIASARVIIEAGAAGNFYELFYEALVFSLSLFNGTIRGGVNSYQIGPWIVLFIHWNAGNSFIDWNNRFRNTVTGSPGVNSSTGATTGAQFNGVSPSNIDVLERIVYTSKPSDSDINLIMQRMIAQYGEIF